MKNITLADVPTDIATFRLLSLLNVEALVRLKSGAIELVEASRHLYQDRWQRVELDKTQFAHLASAAELAPLSLEIISAESTLPDHLHYHRNSYALITLLGEEEGFPEPEGCMMFFKTAEPLPARSGITLQIPAGVVHSFSSGGSKLSFLSIQSRKIDADYHYAETEPAKAA